MCNTLVDYLRILLALVALACSGRHAVKLHEPESSASTVKSLEQVEVETQSAARQTRSEIKGTSCGSAPSKHSQARILADSAVAFGECAGGVRDRLNLSQAAYLQRKHGYFPLGYGLEDAVLVQCFEESAQVRSYFASLGICSDFSVAILVLECARVGDNSDCDWDGLIRQYYRSWQDWHTLKGAELPEGIVLGRHRQRVEREYASIEGFLSLLADHVDPTPFDPSHTRPIDSHMIDQHLGASISIADVNRTETLHVSAEEVVRQAREGAGAAFVDLMMLGWTYGVGAAQISELRFKATDERIQVLVGSAYELRFTLTDGGPRLTEVRQLRYSDL
jgi:hypothetical protein